jgi:hypothetical protein
MIQNATRKDALAGILVFATDMLMGVDWCHAKIGGYEMCEKSTEENREEQIQRAFEDMRDARIELHEISEADLAAREALKIREAELLLSGAIIGKNAETRAAELKNGCKEELIQAEKKRALKVQVQLRMDLASMRVQELQWLIRNDQACADFGRVA